MSADYTQVGIQSSSSPQLVCPPCCCCWPMLVSSLACCSSILLLCSLLLLLPLSHLLAVSQLNRTTAGKPNTRSHWDTNQAWVAGSLQENRKTAARAGEVSILISTG